MELSSMSHRKLVAGLALFLPAQLSVAGEFNVWVAPAVIHFGPDLKSFEDGAFKAKTYVDGSVAGNTQSSTITNDLPAFGASVDPALELGVTISDRASIYIGGFRWSESTSNTVETPFPLQDSLNQVEYARSAHLSFNDRYLGLEYRLNKGGEKFGLHGRIVVHQAYNIDYVEEYGWNVTGGPATGEKRTFKAEMGADNAYLPELAIAGTYAFLPWLTAAFDFGYVYDTSATQVRNRHYEGNVTGADQVSIFLPIAATGSDGGIQHRAGSRDNMEDLKIDFSGWRVSARIVVSLGRVGS